MLRRISTLMIALIAMVSFLYLTHGQTAEKGWEKTITLPSGEVILDMSGEWDDKQEFYGLFSWVGTIPDILTITQQGTRFTAVKQIGSQYSPKGTETIKGELDKNGFKVIHTYICKKRRTACSKNFPL